MSVPERWEPYAGDQQSGHQGDTSEDSEPMRRARIGQVLKFVADSEGVGVTWKEYAKAYDLHHGIASSALSNLHRNGMVARLTVRRNGCGVYVLTEYVGTRATVPYRRNKKGALTREQITDVVHHWYVERPHVITALVDRLIAEQEGTSYDEGRYTDQ